MRPSVWSSPSYTLTVMSRLTFGSLSLATVIVAVPRALHVTRSPPSVCSADATEGSLEVIVRSCGAAAGDTHALMSAVVPA